jgi:hypothetical protein
MASHDTLIFRDFDVVTGPPNVNGFVHDDTGVLTTEPAESGYVNGSRMYIGGAGLLQPIIFQCVKQGNCLVLGFFARGDLSFDDEDAIVIALRPNAGAGNMAARRIDIFPVWGVDSSGPGIGYGAAEQHPVTPNAPETFVANPPNNIRTRKNARSVQFYSRIGNAGSWTPYTPSQWPAAAIDASDADPGGNYRVRVRSWEPNTAPFEAAWSAEVRIPIDVATGGADWINLNAAGFGLYFSIVRAGRTEASGPLLDNYCTQFRFPDFLSAGVAINSKLVGSLDDTTVIDPSWYGTGLINPAATAGSGVRFSLTRGVTAVGRRDPGNTTMVPEDVMHILTPNDMVAILENTGSAVSGVKAVFRLGKYGLNGWGSWSIPTGMGVASSVSLAAGTPAAPSAEAVSVSQFTVPMADQAGYQPPNHHRCMWVDLTATNAAVTFTQSSIRRNMNFVNLSDHETTAVVSGEGYPEPANGTDKHDFLLFTRCRSIVVQTLVDHMRRDHRVDPETLELVKTSLILAPDVKTPNNDVGLAKRAAGTDWKDSVVHLWITEGYRRTGEQLSINGRKMEILDESPGAFGLIAHHRGIEDNFSWALDGLGMVNHGRGIHELKVPHKGEVALGVKLSASRDGPKGDVSKDPPAGGGDNPKPDEGPGDDKPTKSCLPVMLALAMIPGLGLATYLTS